MVINSPAVLNVFTLDGQMLASARLKSQIVQVRAAAVANYASFFFWIMQNVQV
jgi:hypothetical protein